MANIKTSKLNQRITLLVKTRSRNEFFEWIETWNPDRKMWCSVKQQYFKDYQDTYGTTLANTTNFIIRYDTGQLVSKSNRIEFKGKQYRIEDILEGSFDRDFTTLVCKQVED